MGISIGWKQKHMQVAILIIAFVMHQRFFFGLLIWLWAGSHMIF